jgi:hypothetical protein
MLATRFPAAEPGAGAKTRMTSRKIASQPLLSGTFSEALRRASDAYFRSSPIHGSSRQRPFSLQPGLDRPGYAKHYGRATPG